MRVAALLLVVGTVAAFGCVGGGVFFQEKLTGKYALWAVEGLAGNSVVEESDNGRACSVLIQPTVFAVGFNADFIIAARHPETGPLTFDREKTEYWVVTTADGEAHGPADAAAFPELRRRLNVPETMTFTLTIDSLARGQSANPRLDAPLSGVTALAQGRKRGATGRARQAQR